MTSRTAADPRTQWLQMDRHRLEQALQAASPGTTAGALTSAPNNDADPAGSESAPAGNHVERRTSSERRVVYDRRQLIRFEDCRRSGLDRRAGNDSREMA